MAGTGASTLSGDATMTVTAEPIPIPPLGSNAKNQIAGGVWGTHQSFAHSALTVTQYTGAGPHNNALGSAALTATTTLATAGNAQYFTDADLTILFPAGEGSTPNEPVYFLVTGSWYDVETPDPSLNTNQALWQVISGFVTFWPRVPPGFVAICENVDPQDGTGIGTDLAIAIAPITVRILSGQLQTINRQDTPGVQLLANTPLISDALATQIDPLWLYNNNVSPGQLIYDVQFTKVIYGEAPQLITPFGFAASADATQVCLTDPGITRYPYGGPTR